MTADTLDSQELTADDLDRMSRAARTELPRLGDPYLVEVYEAIDAAARDAQVLASLRALCRQLGLDRIGGPAPTPSGTPLASGTTNGLEWSLFVQKTADGICTALRSRDVGGGEEFSTSSSCAPEEILGMFPVAAQRSTQKVRLSPTTFRDVDFVIGSVPPETDRVILRAAAMPELVVDPLRHDTIRRAFFIVEVPLVVEEVVVIAYDAAGNPLGAFTVPAPRDRTG